MAWDVKRWGVMPEAGGLRDQPAGLVKKMNWCDNTYEIVKARMTAKDVGQWIDDNPEAYEFYAVIRKMLNEDDRNGE